MVSIRDHGGMCCGARHIYNFTDQEETNPLLIIEALQRVPHGRMVEAILNDRQLSTMPRTLETLKMLGFVLTDVYINHNHGPQRRNYRFSYCSDRRALTEAARYWTGMVASIEANGGMPPTRLPQLRNRMQPPPPPPTMPPGTHPETGHPIEMGQTGARYRVVRRDSPHFNQFVFLREPLRNTSYYAETLVGSNRLRASFRRTSLVYDPPERARPPVAPARQEPHAPIEPYVHNGAILLTNAGQAVAAPAPQAVPVVVATTYHNVLRTGRSDAGFSTYQNARAAAPRAQGIVDKREILSDGSVRWETVREEDR